MNILKATPSQENLGPAYIDECPSCTKNAVFNLIQDIYSLKLAIFTIQSISSYYLVCGECNVNYNVTDEEVESARRLCSKFTYTNQSEMQEECHAIDFKSITKEKVYQTQNTCPSCKETSPGNFGICWNCGAEIEEAILDGNSEYEFNVDPVFGKSMRKIEN